MGDLVQGATLDALRRSIAHPTNPLFPGQPVSNTGQGENNHKASFLLNASSDPVHYGWRSHRSLQDCEHSLRAYAFVPDSSGSIAEADAPGSIVFRCVGYSDSPTFTFGSQRRARALKAAAAAAAAMGNVDGSRAARVDLDRGGGVCATSVLGGLGVAAPIATTAPGNVPGSRSGEGEGVGAGAAKGPLGMMYNHAGALTTAQLHCASTDNEGRQGAGSAAGTRHAAWWSDAGREAVGQMAAPDATQAMHQGAQGVGAMDGGDALSDATPLMMDMVMGMGGAMRGGIGGSDGKGTRTGGDLASAMKGVDDDDGDDGDAEEEEDEEEGGNEGIMARAFSATGMIGATNEEAAAAETMTRTTTSTTSSSMSTSTSSMATVPPGTTPSVPSIVITGGSSAARPMRAVRMSGQEGGEGGSRGGRGGGGGGGAEGGGHSSLFVAAMPAAGLQQMTNKNNIILSRSDIIDETLTGAKGCTYYLAGKERKSTYRGVSTHKKSYKWQARVKVNGKDIHLGSFR